MNASVTAAEFMRLWEATDLDRMPYPLQSRSGSTTHDAHPAHALGPELPEWIEALRYPDLSVTVYAPGSAESPVIRRRGCVRGDLAVLAEQLSDGARSGDIRICTSSGGESRNLAGLALGLVGDLRECAAGTVGTLTAHPDDVELGNSRSHSVLRSAVPSRADRIRCLLGRPRSGIGYVCVRGPRSGLDEPLIDEFTWIDVSGDGRYLHRVDHFVHLRPVSPVQIYEELLRRLRAVVAR
ncbi:MAG: ESX secretion-associated protein EspG [Rhodococcus sp.]|nr:ESX secretion-associated protein EspG [Rhodococcus sp. (in: high G+C Gram-positive bacteria)]